MTRKRFSKGRGYTAIEVMMAMTMLIIGAVGVIAMQKAAVQGNADAREIDMAQSIARQWMERLHRDAATWTLSPDVGAPINQNLASAVLVNANLSGAWFIPTSRMIAATPQDDVESPALDPLGRDLTVLTSQTQGAAGTVGVRYCTHMRLTPLLADQSLIRAEVRVFWPKGTLSAPTANFCSVVPTAAFDLATDKYHFVYVASVLKPNVQP